jgi:GNAT superfamily N-acetyltransferase
LLTGIADPGGRTVVAVPPAAAEVLARPQRRRNAGRLELLPGILGRAGHTVDRVAFLWTEAPADLPDAGVWVDTCSPRLPAWLRPFGGQALVAFGSCGEYLAGVGIKRHDQLGHEISVGTEPAARGQGLARRLVAQAARHILEHGRIPTYLHTFDNLASAPGRRSCRVPRPRLVRAHAQRRAGFGHRVATRCRRRRRVSAGHRPAGP